LGISRAHGFFICMGGFVSRSRHNPIVIKKQLREELGFVADIRAVEEEDIRDKSKGDTLSKGVALMQGIWFMAQCLARVHQRLPVSELEVTTLAFAVVNIFIYALWWGKPLDVQRPILVGPPQEELCLVEPEPDDNKKSVPLGSSAEKPHVSDPEPWRGSLWVDFVGSIAGGYEDNYNPTSYTSLPSFWATASDDPRDKSVHAISIECFVGAIFGGIHCAAWNVDFPSTTEMWMWRCTALGEVKARWWDRFTSRFYSALHTQLAVCIPSVLVMTIYPIARLYLIILPLISLRDLPMGTFTDVDWNVYIPHL
ncbi:hypothetical protein C8R43DRAFT_900933, partial [Mycena crocata]